MKDSIRISSIINETEAHAPSTHKEWLYVLLLIILASIVIGLLAYFRSDRYKKKRALLKQEENVDFNNVMNNAFLSKQLYDELKSRCHPDKFATDEALSVKATEIMALIVKNKHNYKELLDLKERAVKELGINFKKM